jgi:hypothetical protein
MNWLTLLVNKCDIFRCISSRPTALPFMALLPKRIGNLERIDIADLRARPSQAHHVRYAQSPD